MTKERIERNSLNKLIREKIKEIESLDQKISNKTVLVNEVTKIDKRLK